MAKDSSKRHYSILCKSSLSSITTQHTHVSTCNTQKTYSSHKSKQQMNYINKQTKTQSFWPPSSTAWMPESRNWAGDPYGSRSTTLNVGFSVHRCWYIKILQKKKKIPYRQSHRSTLYSKVHTSHRHSLVLLNGQHHYVLRLPLSAPQLQGWCHWQQFCRHQGLLVHSAQNEDRLQPGLPIWSTHATREKTFIAMKGGGSMTKFQTWCCDFAEPACSSEITSVFLWDIALVCRCICFFSRQRIQCLHWLTSTDVF